MAQPNRPSLMSRLFPPENCPAGQLSTADLSSSTLFSAERAQFGSSSSSSSFQDENLRRNDLFQACFASFGNAAEARVQQDKPVEGDMLATLKRAFAEEGVKLHDSVRSKLLEAQQDISSKMTDFTTLSSSMASTIDEIYANLSYPASATLCSSARFPPATINTHLADAKGQLEEAEKKLRNLQDEWEENVCLEENFRRELASIEKIPGRIDTNPRMISLKEEVEQLVLDNTQALDEIEDTYKEEIQAETMKMMQAMLVD